MPLLTLVLTSLLAATASPAKPPDKAPAQADSVSCDKPQDKPGKDDDSGPPQTPEEKAAQAAYRSYQISMAHSLQNSADPRDRALATQLEEITDIQNDHDPTSSERAARGAILRTTAEAAPDDLLVQWMWTLASPEDSGCDAGRRCPHRFDAVVRMQPDNGAAWLPVFDATWRAKDVPSEESTLSSMARATSFEDPQGLTLKAWMAIYQRYPVPASVFVPGSVEAKYDGQTVEFTAALAYAASMVILPYGGVVDACHQDRHPDASPQRFRDCAQVGRLMLTHSKSMLGQRIGLTLLRVSRQATTEDIANARVAAWQYEQMWNLLPSDNEPANIKQYAADWLDTGDEIQVLQRKMQRKGIPLTPPVDWQPHGRGGKPISPLGEDPAPSK